MIDIDERVAPLSGERTIRWLEADVLAWGIYAISRTLICRSFLREPDLDKEPRKKNKRSNNQES